MADINTEEKILQAARDVFTTKGLDGARMQDIADTAGINKALLHYYFRSKDKLFQRVFLEKGEEMATMFENVVNTDMPIREKILKLIDHQFQKLQEEPMMSLFLITELNRNPDKIFAISNKDVTKIHLKKLFDQIEQGKKDGTINKNVEAQNILIDIMSLLSFPRLSRPLLVEMFFDRDEQAFAKVLSKRLAHVKTLILKSIEP